MSEPVQGIKAVPDESNARYFHVVVAGPSDVSLSCLQILSMLWPDRLWRKASIVLIHVQGSLQTEIMA